eukprot:6701498-Pyramimonas_sp.AAC.2
MRPLPDGSWEPGEHADHRGHDVQLQAQWHARHHAHVPEPTHAGTPPRRAASKRPPLNTAAALTSPPYYRTPAGFSALRSSWLGSWRSIGGYRGL